VTPEPPRNVRLHIRGETVPVELRYDGLRWDPQAATMLHQWTAVTRYRLPDEATDMQLSADEIPALTTINIEFLE
jgi:hypothetical protein